MLSVMLICGTTLSMQRTIVRQHNNAIRSFNGLTAAALKKLLFQEDSLHFVSSLDRLKSLVYDLVQVSALDTAIAILDPSGEMIARDTVQSEALLSIAASRGNNEVLKLLLLTDVDKDKPSLDGETPLYSAVYNGQLTAVNILLEAEVDLNTMNNDSQTALYCAAKRNHRDIAARLLAAGADANKADSLGITPLHKAVLNGNHGMVTELLVSGVDKNKADAAGIAPLHSALMTRNDFMVKILLTAHALREGLLLKATEMDYLEAVQWLLIAGADMNESDHNGMTALHIAASKNLFHIVDLLLLAGADKEKCNRDGFRPFDMPRDSRSEEVETKVFPNSFIHESISLPDAPALKWSTSFLRLVCL